VTLSGSLQGETANGWHSGETHFSMSAEGAKDDISHFNLSGKRTECLIALLIVAVAVFSWVSPFGLTHFLCFLVIYG
jgi:hypothetical protein